MTRVRRIEDLSEEEPSPESYRGPVEIVRLAAGPDGVEMEFQVRGSLQRSVEFLILCICSVGMAFAVSCLVADALPSNYVSLAAALACGTATFALGCWYLRRPVSLPVDRKEN